MWTRFMTKYNYLYKYPIHTIIIPINYKYLIYFLILDVHKEIYKYQVD